MYRVSASVTWRAWQKSHIWGIVSFCPIFLNFQENRNFFCSSTPFFSVCLNIFSRIVKRITYKKRKNNRANENRRRKRKKSQFSYLISSNERNEHEAKQKVIVKPFSRDEFQHFFILRWWWRRSLFGMLHYSDKFRCEKKTKISFRQKKNFSHLRKEFQKCEKSGRKISLLI